MRVVPHRELEAIAEQILAECRSNGKKTLQQKVVLDWRSKLEKPPTSLRSFQVDQIMRIVHDRLAGSG